MRKISLITLGFLASVTTLSMAASTATWDFSTPTDYTYDAARVQVTSGAASLVPTANWWNTLWPYRKAITVNNATGSAQANMFVRVSLTSAQTDFWPFTTANGFDVRFVDSAQAALSFNRTSWDSSSQSAAFNVRFTNLPTGPSTFYLYYGNQGAADASTSLLTLVGAGGVETTYASSMDYLAVNLGASLFVPGGVRTAFPGTQDGDESNLTISLSSFATGFPYFGARYSNVKVNANGCVHPYTTSPIQMGDASIDGETTPNGPCSWGGVNDLFSVPRRLIYPHYNDKYHPGATDGLYTSYVAGSPSEYRLRWLSRGFNSGGVINVMARLKSNGNIQFDYGPIPNGDIGRVGISAGTGAPGYLIAGYDASNVNNANSIEFRAYKISSGTPSFGLRETQYPSTSPTIAAKVARPFTSIIAFNQNATTPVGTEIRYILSSDAMNPADCSTALTWLFWNGTAWAVSNQSVVQSSTPAEISANLGQFPHLGNLCWRAFLRSDGTGTPLLDLLSITLSEAQPDAHIAYVPGAGPPVFIGNNIFNTDGSNQSIAAQVSTPQTFLVRVQNDGLFADSFKYLVNPVPGGWTAQYFDAESGGNPIPESVITTAGYTTPALAVGAAFTIRAVYTPTVDSTPGVPMNLLFNLSSSLEPAIVDAVGITLTPVFARPDLLLGTDPSLLSGAGDYSLKNYDFVEFYVCVEGMHNCNNPTEGVLIATFTDDAFTWRLSRYPLNAFANQSIRLKFRMSSTAANTAAGFYLDDVTVKPNDTGSPLLSDNFESGTTQWFFINVGAVGNDWHTVTCDSNSPSTSLFSGEGACGSYANQKETLAITLLPVSLAGTSSPFVEFWRKFALEPNSGQVLPLNGSQSVSFYVRLRNNGNTVGNLNLRAQGPRQGDSWSVSFVRLPFGPDDSADILSAGHLYQLSPNEDVTLRATVTLLPALNGSEILSVPVFVTDSASPFGQDQVLANVTVNNAYQPDSLIADNPAGPFFGGNLYDPTQFLEHLAGPGVTRRFYVRLQNDGNIKDDLQVKASVTNTQGNAVWDVKYFDAFTGGNDITGSVTSPAGFVYPGLLRGQEANLRVEMTPDAPIGQAIQFNSSHEIALGTESVSNPASADVARLKTRVAYIVDAEAGQSQNCVNMTGLGIINSTGANQGTNQTASVDTPAFFCVNIHNIGFQTPLKISGAIDSTGAWDIRYFLPGPNNTLTEITGLFAAGGYTTSALNTNESQILFVRMTPLSALPDGAAHEIAITGASTAFTGVVDVVKLRAVVAIAPQVTYDVDLVVDGRGAGIRGALNTGDGGRTQKTVVEGSLNFTVPLVLRNNGNTTDTITMTLSATPPLPPNWVLLLNDGTQNRAFPVVIAVPPATQQLYALIINVPLGGTSRSIFVNAQSGGDQTAVDSIAVDLTVALRRFLADGVIDGKGQDVIGGIGSGAGGVSTHNVILLPQPFTQTDFLVDIFNKGNVADSFSVSWSTPVGWIAHLVDGNNLLSSPVSTPSVQPGQSKSYVFRVQVPSTASSVTPFYLDIQSLSSPTVVDSLLAGINPTVQPSTQLAAAKGLPFQNRSVTAGATRIPMLQIVASASQLGNPVRLRGFTLRASGSGDDSRSVQRVQLWRDDDNNGLPDSPLPLAESVFFADDGPTFLDISQVEILNPNQTRRYLVTYDFGALTASGHRVPSRHPLVPASLLLACALLFGFGIRSRRSWLLAVALLIGAPAVFTSCNGGGAPVIELARTFRAAIESASQITALDSTTGLPASITLTNPPIVSAEVTLQ
jgi:hypothetical protein